MKNPNNDFIKKKITTRDIINKSRLKIGTKVNVKVSDVKDNKVFLIDKGMYTVIGYFEDREVRMISDCGEYFWADVIALMNHDVILTITEKQQNTIKV